MQVEIDKRFTKQVIRDRRRMERPLVKRAKPIARRMQAGTPVRTGHTAGTTTVETGHLNAKRDRVAVRIVQRGASVPLNWRLRRNYILKAI